MLQNINLGSTPNDKTGDSARMGGDKINKNFTYLEGKIATVDQLVSETGFVLVGQDLTMTAGWEWLINGVNYSNSADVIINIPFASSENQRIDLIVMNTSNTFARVPGIENMINPVAPLVPNDTIQATLILVSDAAINEPAAPITGNSYIAKRELSSKKLYGTGNKAEFSLTDDVATFRIMEATSIGSVAVAANNKKYLYSGKDHFVRNETGGDLIINHNSGTGNYKYFFANEVDLTIKNNEIVHFKFRLLPGNDGFLDFVGVAGVTISQDIETDKGSTTFVASVKQIYDWAVGKFQLKLISGTTIKTINGTTLLGSGDIVVSAEPQDTAQITITTTVSITTDTLGNLGKSQNEKNVIIDNGSNAINITVNGGTDFLASYLKHGSGAITFVQGAGRTLTLVDATAILNGALGSTATISSIGTTDYLRISNAI